MSELYKSMAMGLCRTLTKAAENVELTATDRQELRDLAEWMREQGWEDIHAESLPDLDVEDAELCE